MLCAPLIERLTSVTFSKLEEVLPYPMLTSRIFTSALKYEAEELLRQRKLGFSFVRLLPKDTGVRPIVNLRRKRAEINVSQTTCHGSRTLDNTSAAIYRGKRTCASNPSTTFSKLRSRFSLTKK